MSYITNHLISKEEKSELIQLFADWDLDGNGMLSTAEIGKGYQKAFGEVDMREVKEIIDKLDSDKNCSIDYHEFLNGTINSDKIITRENLEHAFKAFDVFNAGVLTYESINKLFSSSNNKKIDKSIFDKIVRETNESEEINSDEITFNGFKKIMMQFYT